MSVANHAISNESVDLLGLIETAPSTSKSSIGTGDPAQQNHDSKYYFTELASAFSPATSSIEVQWNTDVLQKAATADREACAHSSVNATITKRDTKRQEKRRQDNLNKRKPQDNHKVRQINPQHKTATTPANPKIRSSLGCIQTYTAAIR